MIQQQDRKIQSALLKNQVMGHNHLVYSAAKFGSMKSWLAKKVTDQEMHYISDNQQQDRQALKFDRFMSHTSFMLHATSFNLKFESAANQIWLINWAQYGNRFVMYQPNI